MRLLKTITFFLFLLSSCKEKPQFVTKAEALQIANEIDSAINFKKPRHFNSLIDEKSFSGKVAKQAGLKVSADIISGVKEAMGNVDIGDKIIKGIANNGMYQFVKHYEKEKIHHLIFRLYSDDGLNYHDFELVKRDGKVYIGDIYIYLSGENLSKTISDLMLSLKPGKGKAAGKQLEELGQLKKIRDLIYNNEYQRARDMFSQLSPEFKKQKSVQIMNVVISAQIDEASYIEAIDNYKTSFPGEPNLYLILIDRYLLKKEYDKSLECINSVDSLLEKDSFLDFYRALIFNMMEQPDNARKYLEQLHLNMPGFGTGVLELIANYITAGMNDKARVLIREYEKNEKFDQEMLENYLYTQPDFKKE